MKKSVSAAQDAQRVQAQTESQLKSLGISYGAHAKEIDKAITATSKLAAIDDEELQGSFNDLVRVTGNVKEALRDVTLETNVSRGAHISLALAQRAVVGAEQGRSTVLRKLGIDIPKVTDAQNALKIKIAEFRAEHAHLTSGQLKEIQGWQANAKEIDKQATKHAALAALQEKFGGAAKAYGESSAAAGERFGIALENLEESLGKVLLPTITAVSNKAGEFAEYLTEHEGLAKALVIGFGVLAGILLTVSAATKVHAAATAIASAAKWAFTTSTVAATAATEGEAAAQAQLNVALTANPIGIVVVALAALGIGLYEAWKHSETFRNVVTGAFETTRGIVSGFVDFFTVKVPGAFSSTLSWLRGNWPEIATIVSGPFAPIVLLATNAFGVRSALTGAFGDVKSWVRANWPEIATLISGPFFPIVALATNAFGVRTALVGAFDATKNAVAGATHELASIVTGAWNSVRAAVASAIAGILNAIDSFLGGLQSVFSAASHIPGIGGKFDAVSDAIGRSRTKVQGLQADMDRISGKKVGTRVDVDITFHAPAGARGPVGVTGAGEGLVGAISRGAATKAKSMPNDYWADLFPELIGAGKPGGGGLAANPGGLRPQILDELKIAQDMGLVLTSGYRPGAITSSGNVSLHSLGLAIDVGPPGPTAGRFARTVAGRPGIREVIYSPIGWWHPGAGWGPITDAQIKADHYSHVHVGTYDVGGILPPGLTLARNMTGGPEVIFTREQTRMLAPVSEVAGARGGGDIIIENLSFPNYVGSKSELLATVRSELGRLQLRNGSTGIR